MNAVPVSVALAAGGLAVINPCGFPLLPAFLSFYLGTDEHALPRAPTRILQGLLVGALVSVGFLGLFALVGLPVSFGVALVARAVPWAGLVTGALLALAGLVALAGLRIALPLHLHVPVKKERRLGAMLLFGVGYGAASLGCTLPLFLTLIAASSGPDKLTVFAAYATGTAVVLMALAVLVALAREGVARAVRPALPYLPRVAGLLLGAARHPFLLPPPQQAQHHVAAVAVPVAWLTPEQFDLWIEQLLERRQVALCHACSPARPPQQPPHPLATRPPAAQA